MFSRLRVARLPAYNLQTICGAEAATLTERYLRFENIDLQKPDIYAWCSACGMQFMAIPKAGERLDDLLHRMRDAFNAHQCDLPSQEH